MILCTRLALDLGCILVVPFRGRVRHRACAQAFDQPCSWRDGEAVIFDETYIHQAENRTDVERLILSCGVARPMRTGFARRFNTWFGRHVVAAANSPNDVGDRTGLINRHFFLSGRAGRLRRRFKACNRGIYRAAKAGLVVALLAALLLPGSVRTLHHVLKAEAGGHALDDRGKAPSPPLKRGRHNRADITIEAVLLPS